MHLNNMMSPPDTSHSQAAQQVQLITFLFKSKDRGRVCVHVENYFRGSCLMGGCDNFALQNLKHV